MTEPADAGGHIRALAAEDKTYGETLRRTIMAPEEDEVSTTQEIANRHKPDKAARDLEWRQSRGAEKAANEHDLAKSRNVNKQQREDE